MAPSFRAEWPLAVLAACGATLFALALPALWPLPDADLFRPRDGVTAEARDFLQSQNWDLGGYRSAVRLEVDEAGLDYVDRALGREAAQSAIRQGLPLLYYEVRFKRAGDPRQFTVSVHPERGIIDWWSRVEDDEPGPRLSASEARAVVAAVLRGPLGLDSAAWTETAAELRERPRRRDHTFSFERDVGTSQEFRERIVAAVTGGTVSSLIRYVVVPPAVQREDRNRRAPAEALQALGVVLVAVGVLGAFAVFVKRVPRNPGQLSAAAAASGLALAGYLGTEFLAGAGRFAQWDPLWPRWVGSLHYLVGQARSEIPLFLLMLAMIAAADAVDREKGWARGEALWLLLRGSLFHERVALASLRGFLVGLVCAGVLAGSVLAVTMLADGRTALQPRGFFLYPINATLPSLATLLFFLAIALLEESGYRFFATAWIESATGRRWLAILLPALAYGLTHTTLTFLPPAEPAWGRAIAMTLVGCVWGVAFLRYDALTVVLSHFAGDLFIFSWPRLASGDPGHTAAAALVFAVPLLPAAGYAIKRLKDRRSAR